MIRVGDMRKRGGLTAVATRMFLLHEHTTSEGEYIPFHATKLEVDEVLSVTSWHRHSVAPLLRQTVSRHTALPCCIC